MPFVNQLGLRIGRVGLNPIHGVFDGVRAPGLCRVERTEGVVGLWVQQY